MAAICCTLLVRAHNAQIGTKSLSKEGHRTCRGFERVMCSEGAGLATDYARIGKKIGEGRFETIPGPQPKDDNSAMSYEA